MIVAMIMMMAMAMGLCMVMMMAMAMGISMVMGMNMVMVVGMNMVLMMLLCRPAGAANSYRIVSISASACVTHNYSFYSTNKDFICNSVPRISLIPLSLHSGQWLNIPSGV